MKKTIFSKNNFLFLIALTLFSVQQSLAQKKTPVKKQTVVAPANTMHSAEEAKLFALINEIRNDPQSFASNNKSFIEKNYPEFYLRLTSSSKLEPLTEECNFANVARAVLSKTKYSPCHLHGGHTMAPLLTDESKGDFSAYSDLQLVCAVNFNLLEPDPNYIGICLVKNKGIVITVGNYEGEEHTYHAEIKEYKAALAKKNIYLFQHMEPAIDRQLVLLINDERKKRGLSTLKRVAGSKANTTAGMYNSLYYNESLYGLRANDTAGALKSKSGKFAQEHSKYNFKGFYKKLTVLEHIVDTVTLAKELYGLFLASEKNSAFLFDAKQKTIGLNVNSSGSNFCLFATIAFNKDAESVTTEEMPKPLGQVEVVGSDMYKINKEVLRLVNELRASKGLKPITDHPVTESAAFYHNIHMSKTGSFSHSESNPGYETVGKRVNKFIGEEKWWTVVENISWFSDGYFGNKSVKEIAFIVYTEWKESPGHYANFINPNTNYASCAGVLSGRGAYFTYVGMQKD
ncbi:MAG: CAP domain-containing protein [Bacteroidia bacterium]|nr:CAP domain-containing protein [Bacteroidia bacterium]